MLYIKVYGYIAALHKEKYNLEMIVAGGYKSFKYTLCSCAGDG